MNAQTTALEMVGTRAIGSLSSVTPEAASSILRALGDKFSGKIMRCAGEEARTIEEISSSERIPLSTCYRRMQELVDAGLVVVERIVITGSGKRYATYRSCYRSFRISADPHGVVVEAETNKAAAEKMWNRRLSGDYAGRSAGVA
jgi:DNA-binding transcriptional ArsR family regulator